MAPVDVWFSSPARDHVLWREDYVNSSISKKCEAVTEGLRGAERPAGAAGTLVANVVHDVVLLSSPVELHWRMPGLYVARVQNGLQWVLILHLNVTIEPVKRKGGDRVRPGQNKEELTFGRSLHQSTG